MTSFMPTLREFRRKGSKENYKVEAEAELVVGEIEEGEAKDQSLFVAGINDPKGEGGDGSAGQIRDNVDPNLGEVYQLHHAGAHGHGRVERAAGDGADRECADHHGHADGQPVEGVVRRAFGRGDVEHNESERKSEDKLRDERCRNIRNLHRSAALAAKEDGDKGGNHTGRELRDPIWDHIFCRAFASQENGERDGRIEMSPGDVSGGEDHDHERCADRQRGDHTGRAGDDGAADGEDEEERADKFCDVFVHCFGAGCLEEVSKVESRKGF